MKYKDMSKERKANVDELENSLKNSGKERWEKSIEAAGGIENIPEWEKIAFEIGSCTARHEGFPIGSLYEEDKEEGKHYLDLVYEKFLELDDKSKLEVVRYLHGALNRSRMAQFGERAVYTGIRPAYLFMESKEGWK